MQWDDCRRHRVLKAMETTGRPTLPRLSRAVVLAAVLCLLAGVALATSLLYSRAYTQRAQADALLSEHYGITADQLSFFTRTASENVYTYKSLPEFAGMPGDYLVDLNTGEVQWLCSAHDGWDAAKLSEVLLRCQTQDGYAQVVQEAQQAAASLGLTVPNAAPRPTPATAADDMEAHVKTLARISLAEAVALSRAAIQEQYSLTNEQMQLLEFVETSTHYVMEDDVPLAMPYFWLNQNGDKFTEKDGIYIVDVNMLDGAIENVYYDTALLGNG